MGYPSSRRPPRILVVAPPDLPRARRLADELYNLGWNVTLADSPGMAMRVVVEATACVVVLTRDEWRDPAIVAAIRARPAMLIPVLTEPMQLPEGPWTEAPIEMRLSPPAVARQIIEVIEDMRAPADDGGYDDAFYPPTPSRPRLATPARPYFPDSPSRPRMETPSRPRMEAFSGTMYAPMPPNATIKQGAQRKKKPNTGRRLLLFFLVLLMVGGGYAGYRYYQQHKGALVAPDPSTSAYTAAKPGQGCDSGNAVWVKSGDANFAFACQPNGLQITQSGDYALFSGAGYQGSGKPLATNYHVQVSVTVQSAEPTNTIGINVHQQKTPQNTLGAGQIFYVQANGIWAAQRLSSDDKANQTLATGVLAQPSKTLTLALDVKGAVMTFTINGVMVSAVTDATYATTNAIALVVSNNAQLPASSTGSSPMIATFSHFQFTPYTGAVLTAANAAATATAQAAQAAQTPYKATTPGPGCDTGGGQWLSPALFGATATATCGGDGLQLAVPAAAQDVVDRVGFLGLDGNFTSNYDVAVQATTNQLNTGYIQLALRVSGSGRYLFSVYGNGLWTISAVDAANHFAQLDSGYSTGGSPLKIDAAVSGKTLTLTLGGRKVTTISDASETTTTYIALGIVAANSQPCAATFSNFLFTPLP